MIRSIRIVILKLVALAALLYVASFYLRLGFFLPAVYAVGAVVAVAVTARQWRGSRPWLGAAGVFIGYVALQLGVFAALTTESREELDMTWREEPADGPGSGREIVLEFEDSPGSYIGIYSDRLAEYLAETGDAAVRVEFELTRDFGCLRGFHETRIGRLTSWTTGGSGYAGSRGGAQLPWTDPWWCP